MRYFWPIITLSWLVAGAIFVALLVYLFQQEKIEFTDIETDSGPSVLSTDPARGNLITGTVPIVTYNHFGCENCKAMNETLEAVMRKYPDEVIHVWKDLPNSTIDESTLTSALAARCAQRQSAFWEYHDLLFVHQASEQEDLLLSIAKELDLNMSRFERCLEKGRTLDLITENVAETRDLTILTAPTLFIGEQRFTGTVTEAALETAILNAKQ